MLRVALGKEELEFKELVESCIVIFEEQDIFMFTIKVEKKQVKNMTSATQPLTFQHAANTRQEICEA